MRPAGEEMLKEPAPQPHPEPDFTEADQLIQRVLDAGGEVELTAGDDQDEIRKLVEQSLKSRLRPYGKKLTLIGDFLHSYAVVIVDYFDELVEHKPVRVLERIGRYHPSVKRFKQDKNVQRVSDEHVLRATLILQSLVQEAQKRGIVVLTQTEARDLARSRDSSKLFGAHLVFKVEDELYAINIRELALKGGEKLENRWKLRGTRPDWIVARGYEFISSGRLELIVEPTGWGEKRYRDGKRKQLEEQLPEVFRRFEISRRYASVAKQLESKKADYEERRRDQDTQIARDRYIEAKTWEHFKDLSERWHRLEKHREFLARAQSAAETRGTESRGELQVFLAQAEQTIDALDPLLHPEKLHPQIQEPAASDLHPYMPARTRLW